MIKLFSNAFKAVLPIVLLSLSISAYAEAPEREKSILEQIVDAQTILAKGPYKGVRANHTKGLVLTGSFEPAPTAASLTKAAHLQSTPSKITVRFSNATGIPTIEDTNPNANPRGIAIRFELPDGNITDIVSLSIHAFPVTTPEAFLGLLNALIETKPDSPKPTPIEKFVGATPSLQRFLAIPKPFPASFASHTYFSINAFQFTNAKNETHYARYRIIPIEGNIFLNPEEVAKASPNYLFEELPERLKKGSAKFRLVAQVASKEDEVNDPTIVWPEGELIELGLISIEAPVADNKAAEKALAFNPLILIDGIAPTNDPILLARPGAYAVSVGRKLTP